MHLSMWDKLVYVSSNVHCPIGKIKLATVGDEKIKSLSNILVMKLTWVDLVVLV